MPVRVTLARFGLVMEAHLRRRVVRARSDRRPRSVYVIVTVVTAAATGVVVVAAVVVRTYVHVYVSWYVTCADTHCRQLASSHCMKAHYQAQYVHGVGGCGGKSTVEVFSFRFR
jgi:hypothetical protein